MSINKINSQLQSNQTQNVNNQLKQVQQTNQTNQDSSLNNQVNSTYPNDILITNNNPPIVPPIGVENPFVQNPFYQAQIPTNPLYLNQTNFQSSGNDLWKYLLAGGIGLFTGLALGSLMPYSYYCYYPMYYSYFYSPCWYNFGWYNYWC